MSGDNARRLKHGSGLPPNFARRNSGLGRQHSIVEIHLFDSYIHELRNLPRLAVYCQTVQPQSRPLEFLNVILLLIQNPGDNVMTECESERRTGVSEKF